MQSNDLKSHDELRNFMINQIKEELVGPSENEEILTRDGPRQRYGAGILFPVRLPPSLENQDETPNEITEDHIDENITGVGKLKPVSEDDGSDLIDSEINLANEFMPSAMGLTVLLENNSNLKILYDYATYVPVTIEKESRSIRGWKRTLLTNEQNLETFGADELCQSDKPIILNRKLPGPDKNGVELRVFVRAPKKSLGLQYRLITVSIINRAQEPTSGGLDAACIYQCGFELQSDRLASFKPLPSKDDYASDDEEGHSQALLYRKSLIFGVGHGVAPDWEKNSNKGANVVFTSTVPDFDIPPILPTGRPDGQELSMQILSKHNEYRSGGAAYNLCDSLIQDYKNWIKERHTEIETTISDPVMNKTAKRHLKICDDCLTRMQRGLELLNRDDQCSLVFARMNQAILAQQITYSQVTEKTREWVFDTDKKLKLDTASPNRELNASKRQWRPFQLAFILMSISSIVLQDEQAFEERDLVDVIWFPTGGGKTEAYLGLTAFTILWRRISNPETGHGTAVLMRYTLRLLTAQQFERAGTLICALEQIRLNENDKLFGAEPITIGLWVGDGLSPNTDSDAVSALGKLQREVTAPNRFVLIKCPWCGARMGVVHNNPRTIKGLHKESKPSRVELCCEAPDCDFSKQPMLPIHVVDERIYEHRPSLIVATVDKFAMLPWRDQSTVGRLFGVDNGGPDAPSLIIQDELHLIAGPLGSMTGHYETLIDELCRRTVNGRTIRAKIVGSTATISRAAEQVASLYGRTTEQAVLFPPQALDAGDSFFAEERPDLKGRRYVGVFAPALPSFVTTEVRTLAALLQAPKLFDNGKETDIDPFWTLVTYFNSIRELGHATTLVDQDIREYLAVMATRLNLNNKENIDKRRWINNPLELTSRISNDQVAQAISQLFIKNNDRNAIDICLATNMIQVGIDVSRLGLMAVVGQPKTTAEYIQATSRVGRSKPGLVIALLNPGKPRDRSHYEHFRAFHEAIYRNVEPTSVTPFAAPVRDRALHALIIGLARLQHGHSDSSSAPSAEVEKEITNTIISRVLLVDPDEAESTSASIRRYFNDWKSYGPVSFGKPITPHPDVFPMMYPAGSDPRADWTDFAKPTAMSMRNVDAECGINFAVLAEYLGD